MPELPEVHTITKDLDKYISGYTIEKAAVAKKYTALPDNEIFVEGVTGRGILGAQRIAKNIILELNSGNYIRFHLAMTGRLLIRDPTHKEDEWVRVLFLISKFAVKKHLRFCDMRMFGKVELLDREGLLSLKEATGLDILDETLTIDKFFQNIKSKRTNIKNVLLNQKVFAGIGNIYATDALFMAHIHPETKTGDITEEKAEILLKSLREVLNEGIANRGATLPDRMYVDAFGKEGKQQDHFKVYMRKRCRDCRSEIEYIKLNNRGTYYCPVCQPKTGQKPLLTNGQ